MEQNGARENVRTYWRSTVKRTPNNPAIRICLVVISMVFGILLAACTDITVESPESGTDQTSTVPEAVDALPSGQSAPVGALSSGTASDAGVVSDDDDPDPESAPPSSRPTEGTEPPSGDGDDTPMTKLSLAVPGGGLNTDDVLETLLERFPLKGQKGPSRVTNLTFLGPEKRSWWMETNFTLGDTGFLEVTTNLESKEITGFTGTVKIVFYDKDENPVAATKAHQFGVNLYSESVRHWSEQLDQGIVRGQVYGYQIFHVHDPDYRISAKEAAAWAKLLGVLVAIF
jgi:hypothetical protein